MLIGLVHDKPGRATGNCGDGSGDFYALIAGGGSRCWLNHLLSCKAVQKDMAIATCGLCTNPGRQMGAHGTFERRESSGKELCMLGSSA